MKYHHTEKENYIMAKLMKQLLKFASEERIKEYMYICELKSIDEIEIDGFRVWAS